MSSKAVGTYFINYHLEMCFCWKERETRSSEFPVLVQNIFVRFCTSKNSAQLPDDLLELKVATTAVNSISDRSNRTAGFIIALFSRIRSPWARHGKMWRKYGKETEVKGNDDTTHRKTEPRMEPSWREVKKSCETIQNVWMFVGGWMSEW